MYVCMYVCISATLNLTTSQIITINAFKNKPKNLKQTNIEITSNIDSGNILQSLILIN